MQRSTEESRVMRRITAGWPGQGPARTGAGLCRGVGPLAGRLCLYFVCVPDLQGLKKGTCCGIGALCLLALEVKSVFCLWGDLWVKVVTFRLCCPQGPPSVAADQESESRRTSLSLSLSSLFLTTAYKVCEGPRAQGQSLGVLAGEMFKSLLVIMFLSLYLCIFG